MQRIARHDAQGVVERGGERGERGEGFVGSPGGEPGDTKHKSGVLAVVALPDGRLVSGDVGGFLCLSESPARF